MRGHIRERSPGHWAIVIEARDGAGKRKRRWFSFHGTKRDAQRKCAELVAGTHGGAATSPERMTVGEYLERWLDHQRPLVSPSSHARYGQLVRVNLVPLIGNVRLAKLAPMQISAAFTSMLANGLSPATVALIHGVLSHALKLAVRWRLLSVNPSNYVSPPRIERAEMRIWNAQTMAAAIELSRDWQCHTPIVLACLAGLRIGEIAALCWRHVDLERGLVAVVGSVERGSSRIKPPKSGKGRSVTLPALAVSELRAWRLRQAEELLRLGIRPDDDTRVVTRLDGLPIHPNSIYNSWASFLADSGLPHIRFHDLRHSHATALLSGGVHPKVASERLGHSTVGITLDIYSHVIGNMQDSAAAAIDAAFTKAKGSKAVATFPPTGKKGP